MFSKLVRHVLEIGICSWVKSRCLSLFYALRKKADSEIRKNVKAYLKSNDYTCNKDDQNLSGVLAICNPDFLAYIGSLGKFIFSSVFNL